MKAYSSMRYVHVLIPIFALRTHNNIVLFYSRNQSKIFFNDSILLTLYITVLSYYKCCITLLLP